MRLLALLNCIVVALVAAPAALAQAPTGGAEYQEPPPPPPDKPIVPGNRAKIIEGGIAAAPANAPRKVQKAVWAANEIVGKPYKYGGGHARVSDTGYDCSGTVSYALIGAKLLKSPMPSGSFMRWGKRGKGRWITTYANGGHMYAVIAGLRLDTSSAGERVSSGKGPRWRKNLRGGRGFKKRHPAGF